MAHVGISDLVPQAVANNYSLCKQDICLEKEFVRTIPINPNISLTTQCNMVPKCAMCFSYGCKDEEIDKNIIDYLIESTFKYSLLNLFTIDGEPLLYSGIERIMYLINGWIGIQTNGLSALLRKDSFLDNIYFLQISLDAATAETYKKFRPDRFNQVIENIKYLLKYRVGKSCLTLIRLDFIIMECTKKEVFDFIDLACSLGVDRVYYSYLFNTGNIIEDRIINGYVFNYKKECLDKTEVLDIMDKVVRYSDEKGMVVILDRPDSTGKGL